jgi:hypothetical protein
MRTNPKLDSALFFVDRALSYLLFWVESLKIRYSSNRPSVLTNLNTRAVIQLVPVSLRPPKQKNSPKGKETIRKVVIVQALKIVLLALFVAWLIAKYISNGTIPFGYLAPLFLSIPFDWFFWNENLEKSLQLELRYRASEFGLDTDLTPASQPPKEIAARGEVQNISAPRERTEIDMEDRKRALLERMDKIGLAGRMHWGKIREQNERFESEHSGEWILINIETGEYVLGNNRENVGRKFDDQFGQNSLSWQLRIGNPTRVSTKFPRRTLQRR